MYNDFKKIKMSSTGMGNKFSVCVSALHLNVESSPPRMGAHSAHVSPSAEVEID